ncbi:MAG: ribosome biogenesis GTPase YlqF [Firmicutes bacterium]|nr:ribosome biogenesis GTPase YlqF [Bacillota bacterium]
MNIQWYPGHMTKTRRMMEEDISLVDIVIELLDARIPYSSKNPDIDTLAKNKYRIVILNKADLADPVKTAAWTKYYTDKGFRVIETNSVTGKGVKDITNVSQELMKEKLEALRKRGRIFKPIRAMIVGIPNVGKSTLINKYVGRKLAKTGDKAGVTRGKQWVKVVKGFELLDTPGILWPKFDDEAVGLKLAFTGALNDDIVDSVTLSLKLIEMLEETYPGSVEARYKITPEGKTTETVLEEIGRIRGFLKKGNEVDFERTASILLDEFRAAMPGRMTLDSIPE